MNITTHPCPHCSSPMPYLPRYPMAVCSSCVERAVDKNGRHLAFYNTSIFGGFEAMYSDTGDVHPSHECFIDGVRCWADEARMGGIVVIIDNRDQ